MNKSEFLCKFDYEDKILLSSIYDKIVLSEKTGNTIYTSEFYPPNVWNILCKITSQHFYNVKIESCGVFKEAERRIICINPKDYTNYPIKLINIINKSNFSTLNHKDYLGALTSTGIKREKFGDLIVIGNCCYAAICEEIVDFIKSNLTRIGKSPCGIKEINIDNEKEIPTYNFENIVINAASNRLDCVVSSLTNLSRAKSNQLIKTGNVLVNYMKSLDKSEMVKENSVITIRGFGKFKIVEEIGWTKREKIKICVKKFI
ncbi:hypothetical protein CLOACE_01630 [Clostridium acetireducens DSM 10703]|jgi:RNA-binding protein YlmH|uniref:RNA-binding S4 domain-containing protein n=1 Tax=Clostridium acetireducens DSM 10703 TaxID=1121290 RepID=A0A1E8F2I6_9CLOT|nr:YlmH/Sll1252 family protein [Clostridium acetireducens]OFI07559.1 hypothetical protein CLOACE_01630 [Clostridium acetireducens DSM 10703]